MIKSTFAKPIGKPTTSTKLIRAAGYIPVAVGGKWTVYLRPKNKAQKTDWGELIHLRHPPFDVITIFADSQKEAFEILAHEFHQWEAREALRAAREKKDVLFHFEELWMRG